MVVFIFNELAILVRLLYRLIMSHTRHKKSITSGHQNDQDVQMKCLST